MISLAREIHLRCRPGNFQKGGASKFAKRGQKSDFTCLISGKIRLTELAKRSNPFGLIGRWRTMLDFDGRSRTVGRTLLEVSTSLDVSY